MIKRYLSMISVVMAMGFMCMSPASAMDTAFNPSFDAPAPDKAITFDDTPVIEPAVQHSAIDSQTEKQHLLAQDHKSVAFSSVQGGGVTSTQGGRPVSHS